MCMGDKNTLVSLAHNLLVLPCARVNVPSEIAPNHLMPPALMMAVLVAEGHLHMRVQERSEK
jgi:hypothetical protein